MTCHDFIVVIEVGVGDQRVALDSAARSASQETDQLYSSQNRHFLSAFRLVITVFCKPSSV